MKKSIAFLVILVSLAACEKSGLPGNRIDVHITTSDVKGTVTDNDALKASGAFSLTACLPEDYREDESTTAVEVTNGVYFSGDGNVTLKSGKWTIKDSPSWIADLDTYFWAWHPVKARVRTAPVAVKKTNPGADDPKYPFTGELTFSYAIPIVDGVVKADSTVDLLFAYSKKVYNGSNGNTLDLTFQHALAQVRFCVSTDDATFDKGLKIKSISISNLNNSGNSSFKDDKFTWTGQSGSYTFTQAYNAVFTTSTVEGWEKGSYKKSGKNYNLYTCKNVFFMIPQTVTSANKMTVVFEYKGKETTRTVDIAAATGDKWASGYYYTYKINATTVGRDIDLTVSLVGWSNRKDEIFI